MFNVMEQSHSSVNVEALLKMIVIALVGTTCDGVELFFVIQVYVYNQRRLVTTNH